MTDALDDIRFLADSDHRAVMLAMLARGPTSRATLRATTGASSATVGRILASFDERGWLVRDGHDYSLTPLGAFVAETFGGLRRDMTLAGELAGLLPGVPMADIGIDVHALRGAFVTHATETNPFAVVSRVRELELASATARSLTDFFPEPCIDGRYAAIVEGTQTFEAVFAPVVIEAAMASPSAEKFAAIVDADRTDIRVYEADIAHPVMVHDGVACLIVRNERNVSIGLIETDDAQVRSWVTDQFERHQAEATPLSRADLGAYAEDAAAEA